MEIVRLKAELEAQKEINSKYQAEFQALLRGWRVFCKSRVETNDKYMAEINQLKGIPMESQKPEKVVIASESSEESSDESSDDSSEDSSSSQSSMETKPKSNTVTSKRSLPALSAASCITETTRRVECEWDGTTYKNT